MIVRPFQLPDQPAVIALWQRCNLTRPWNNPARDIQRKMRVQPHLFLVGVIDDEIVASAMCGYEGHRGWISYFAVDPAHQRNGLGRRMLDEAERLLRLEGCPKINLQVRTSNRQVIEFYRRLGFEIEDNVSLGKRLEHD